MNLFLSISMPSNGPATATWNTGLVPAASPPVKTYEGASVNGSASYVFFSKSPQPLPETALSCEIPALGISHKLRHGVLGTATHRAIEKVLNINLRRAPADLTQEHEEVKQES